MESAKKTKTTNRSQFNEMVRRMKEHPDIARNLTKKCPEMLEGFWQSLQEALNSLGPPAKQISEWKKVWSDYKSAIKKKLAQNKRSINATGGGGFDQHIFTPLEEDVIELLSMKDSIEGVSGSNDFGLPKKRKIEALLREESSPPPDEISLREYSEVEPLEEFLVFSDEEKENEVPSCSGTQQKHGKKLPCQTKLLQEQIALQRELYKKTVEFMAGSAQQNLALSEKIEKISMSLENLEKHEKRKNDILESLLQEISRHNAVIEGVRDDILTVNTDFKSE